MNKPNKNGSLEFHEVPMLETRFLTRLRWFATRWLGDAQAGEDAAQEAMKRVVQALAQGRVKEPQALPAFVYQTARHVCSHRNRTAGRERRMLSRYGGERLLDEPAPDPLHELLADERKAEVRRALAALQEEDRKLLAALYIHEQNPQQIATELQLTAGALRTRKHRALQRLSRQLAASGRTG
jgi:RNA polymerase sigma-70 factor, ECF subfamily